MARLRQLLLGSALLCCSGAGAGAPPWPTCLAAAPSLAWYLDGERQETNGSSRLVATGDLGGGGGGGGSSTFVVTAPARRLARRLNCSAVDPATGRASGASVLLHVQFRPELVKLDAHYEEGPPEPPGLLLVLFALVQAHPPASITWEDQDGRLLANTSHFLIVDSRTYPWQTDHTLEVQLRSLGRNVSIGASQGGGVDIVNTSVLLPGVLGTRIELPLLALVVGAAAALGVLVSLAVLISCLVYRKGKKAAGLTLPPQLLPSDSSHLKAQGARLPRMNLSLPSNLQLCDFTPAPKASVTVDGMEEEERALSEPENNLAVVNRGLSRFPVVGYIYRASSISSEEIWL